MTSTAIGVSILLLLLPVRLRAQEPTALMPGSRVRVHLTTPQPRLVRGRLVSADADSLRLLTESGRDTLAFSTVGVSQLDTTAGRRTRTGKGALLGAGIGAAAGLTLGLAATAEGCSGFCADPTPGEIAAVSLILGGVGAGVGALIGSITHSDRWVPASKHRMAIGVTPTFGKQGIGLMLGIGTGGAAASRARDAGAE
jgi:hypothetical protein